MEEWKYNWWRGSYWKNEEAKLELSSSTDAYKDCDKNSRVVMKLEKGAQVFYREVILINNHVWVLCKSTKESFYIPIRTWNNVSPVKDGYRLGPLEHKIIELPNRKGSKTMKKDTKNGVDIYIDNDKEIMYVSMNQKMTPEAYKKAKEGISVIKGYQVMIFDYINDIKFLN